ncbi:hypothetical protein DFJ43DRAFT_1162519 [Lentinula guzmanii]|uniref:Uncharacterized protein n=1 Tax=Lentinula guzmanii TaxID=2804957 RepID=A0AA38J5Z5_9AGAR|nr:hypothetical protein DFJ43DRAFT_1162519 [Lentinula guzmanii]
MSGRTSERDRPDPGNIVTMKQMHRPPLPRDEDLSATVNSTKRKEHPTNAASSTPDIDKSAEPSLPKKSKSTSGTWTTNIDVDEISSSETPNEPATGRKREPEKDVPVNAIPEAKDMSSSTDDLKHFFTAAYKDSNVPGKSTVFFDCKLCIQAKASKTQFNKNNSSARRHLASAHQGVKSLSELPPRGPSSLGYPMRGIPTWDSQLRPQTLPARVGFPPAFLILKGTHPSQLTHRIVPP